MGEEILPSTGQRGSCDAWVGGLKEEWQGRTVIAGNIPGGVKCYLRSGAGVLVTVDPLLQQPQQKPKGMHHCIWILFLWPVAYQAAPCTFGICCWQAR